MAESVPKYVRYTDEEWAALYVDGKLVQAGDIYLTDEKIATILGVEERSGDAFMLGGQGYNDVARTLAEVESFDEARTISVKLAEAKLTEAADALERARADLAQAKKAKA